MENNCDLLFPLYLYLLISSAMLRLSSSSDSSGRIEFDRSLRQISGFMSIMKLLDIRPLKGDRCSLSMQRDDLKTIEVRLDKRASSFCAVGFSYIEIFSSDFSSQKDFLGV